MPCTCSISAKPKKKKMPEDFRGLWLLEFKTYGAPYYCTHCVHAYFSHYWENEIYRISYEAVESLGIFFLLTYVQ